LTCVVGVLQTHRDVVAAQQGDMMEQYYQPRALLGYTADGQPVYEQPAQGNAAPGSTAPMNAAPMKTAQGYGQQGFDQHGYGQPTPPPSFYDPSSYAQPPHPPAAYAQPPYEQPSYAQPTYVSNKTNGLAIATLVLSLVLGFIAIPFGHIAKAQIRRTGERGSGLATAGLVLGYLSLTVAVALGSFLAYVAHQASTTAAASRASSSQLYAAGSVAPPATASPGSAGSSSGSSGLSSNSGGSSYSAPTAAGAPTATSGVPASNGQWSAAYQGVSVPVAGADWQGFLSDSGARCNANDPAVVIAANATSRVSVCLTANHRYYYRGSRISDGAAIELEDPTPTSAGFLATNKGTSYDISPGGLVITSPSGTVTPSSWTEYWSTN
jgi:hypothetical protein